MYDAVVAVIGWGQEEDLRRSKAAGFDHYLVRPVDPSELRELLRSMKVPVPRR